MNIEIINKLDEITKILEEDKDNIKMIQLRKQIENDKELIDKINIIKNIESYSNEYINLKNEVLNNIKFQEYKNIEKDLYYTIKEINIKLNTLKEKSVCNENN